MSSRRSMKSADQSVLASLGKPTNSGAVSSPSHTHTHTNTPAVSSVHSISVLDRNVSFSVPHGVSTALGDQLLSTRHCSFLLHHTDDNSIKYRSGYASMQQASPNVVSSPERNKGSYKVN